MKHSLFSLFNIHLLHLAVSDLCLVVFGRFRYGFLLKILSNVHTFSELVVQKLGVAFKGIFEARELPFFLL